MTSLRSAHAMSVLTEGRLQMGIGTGRPQVDDERATAACRGSTQGAAGSYASQCDGVADEGVEAVGHRHGIALGSAP
jgi:hypothetical protein